MTVQMNEGYAAALRELLIEQVEAGKPVPWVGRARRWIFGIGAALVIVCAGGGIAYATGLFSGVPGGNDVVHLSKPVTLTGTGTETVQLGPQPPGTNAIDIRFVCLTPGDFTFADGAGSECDSADIASNEAHPTMYTMQIPPGQDSTTITTAPNARWRLTATYSTVTTTAWGVNASGQTYGAANQNGTPDLVAADATNHRLGYVYANQLQGPQPSTPSEAAANNQPARAVTVYEADGKTPVGQFIVGEGAATTITITTTTPTKTPTPPVTMATTVTTQVNGRER